MADIPRRDFLKLIGKLGLGTLALTATGTAITSREHTIPEIPGVLPALEALQNETAVMQRFQELAANAVKQIDEYDSSEFIFLSVSMHNVIDANGRTMDLDYLKFRESSGQFTHNLNFIQSHIPAQSAPKEYTRKSNPAYYFLDYGLTPETTFTIQIQSEAKPLQPDSLTHVDRLVHISPNDRYSVYNIQTYSPTTNLVNEIVSQTTYSEGPKLTLSTIQYDAYLSPKMGEGIQLILDADGSVLYVTHSGIETELPARFEELRSAFENHS